MVNLPIKCDSFLLISFEENIQYTPNSALKKTLTDLEDKLSGKRDSTRVRIVERAGPTVFDLIGNRSPWKKEVCGRPACTPCSGKAGSCRKLNLVYSITCKDCMSKGIKAQYIGESHRTWWDRSSEHINALKTKNEKNALVKHWLEYHGDQQSPPDFQSGVITTCRSALERQIKEAIHIQTSKLDILLNSKGEWGLNMIPQLKITEGGDLVDDQLTDRKDQKLTETSQVNTASKEPKDNFFNQYSQRKRRLKEQKASESGNPINGPGQDKASNDQLRPSFAGLSLSSDTHSAHEQNRKVTDKFNRLLNSKMWQNA